MTLRTRLTFSGAVLEGSADRRDATNHAPPGKHRLIPDPNASGAIATATKSTATVSLADHEPCNFAHPVNMQSLSPFSSR
jgi:hypothetical protein